MSTTVMDQCQRIEPPYAGGEREMALAFLDWQRATLVCKLEGLPDDELRRLHQPSGLSLLWLVKHLTLVERHWFQITFAASIPYTDDRAAYWAAEEVGPDDSAADILAGYQAEVERSRATAAAAAFDDPAARSDSGRDINLRWIVFHMIEETARHNGHADLLREAVDGQTGE